MDWLLVVDSLLFLSFCVCSMLIMYDVMMSVGCRYRRYRRTGTDNRNHVFSCSEPTEHTQYFDTPSEDVLTLEQYIAKLKLKEKEEEEKEIWLTYYSSKHKILLVGEGDFSFSLCLARAFRSAANITATSLDTYDELLIKYSDAKANLESLKELGACLVHGVNVGSMISLDPVFDKFYQRIIFNFPHAGFDKKENNLNQIERHKNVVNAFFKNAKFMLRPDGEIHVNHKTADPYCRWDLVGLASRHFLDFIECVDFNKCDYPGYNNKRGSGMSCDQPFRLGMCATFKFKFKY